MLNHLVVKYNSLDRHLWEKMGYRISKSNGKLHILDGYADRVFYFHVTEYVTGHVEERLIDLCKGMNFATIMCEVSISDELSAYLMSRLRRPDL